ncbi:MAG TPA: DUF885 family protein, partial [Acidimicrobiia bacterium]|nr:DUF885 family protein [Acidimicrobiia bacterium]
MATPFEISDRFTDRLAALDPILATHAGISGHDHECTDYSPDGVAARADLCRETRDELAPHLGQDDETQAFAAMVLTGWLDEQLGKFEARDWRRDINHVWSPFQNMRDVFDVMGKDTPVDWEVIASRLEGFPGMLEGYRQSLEVGLDAGDTVAIRQAESVLEQANAAASDRSRFLGLLEEADAVGARTERLEKGVQATRVGNGEFATWLRDEYLPAARSEDAVGREEYLRGADEFLGMTIDPEETYEWGWDEVHRLRAAMAETASEIDPGLSIS